MERKAGDNGALYARNGRAVTGRLHDEMVMMDPEQGKYFSLNPVATRIWDMLERPMGIDVLCRGLTEEYEVSEIQCREEVTELLAEMVRLRLISDVQDYKG